MKLYQSDLSPFSSRVRICAYAKNLTDLEMMNDLPGGSMHSTEFAALNPIEKIPLLDNGTGLALPESQVIVEYLEDRFPSPAMLPDAAEDRAQARLISRLVDLYIYPPVPQIFGLMRSKDEESVNRLGELGASINHGLDLLEHYLDETGPYCVGPALTMADAALAPAMMLVNVVLSNPAVTKDAAAPERAKLDRVWSTLKDDQHCAKVLGQMQEAMSKFG